MPDPGQKPKEKFGNGVEQPPQDKGSSTPDEDTTVFDTRL